MTVTLSGVSKARARLAEVVAGLRAAASGAVVERAAQKVQSQVAAVSKRILGQHVYTGAAQGSAAATASGGLVRLSSPGYLKYHGWWPFRSGMPPFVVTRALKIFAAELAAALAGERSPLALADEAAEEVAAAKAEKKAAAAKRVADRYEAARKREADKVAKRRAEPSPEEKVVARHRARAQRKADRAYDKAVKAREDRE